MDVGRDIEREKASITNGRCFYDGDLKVEDERREKSIEELLEEIYKRHCNKNEKFVDRLRIHQ